MKKIYFKVLRFFFRLLFVVSSFSMSSAYAGNQTIPDSQRALEARKRVSASLKTALDKKGLTLGSPLFIRIIKAESRLEVWLQKESEFVLFKDYKICNFSGGLGPKTKVGDEQAPEGFYFVKAQQLNPWSRFHLSFNLGFPNAYDRAHGYTGSALMVHGSCVSIGCYAMTDRYIDEIYTLAYAAFEHGQAYFRVHIFPFAMTDENLQKHVNHYWYYFWKNLKEGYDFFEEKKMPPNVQVANKRYVFN